MRSDFFSNGFFCTLKGNKQTSELQMGIINSDRNTSQECNVPFIEPDEEKFSLPTQKKKIIILYVDILLLKYEKSLLSKTMKESHFFQLQFLCIVSLFTYIQREWNFHTVSFHYYFYPFQKVELLIQSDR